MPTKNYEVLSAAIDGQPLSEWRPSTAIDIGPEVHLGTRAIQPGRSGVFQCRARVRNMVFQDRKHKDMASLQFTPTWFGARYVTGQTDVHLIVEFPKGVDPDRSSGTRACRTSRQKGILDPEGVPFVAWQATYALTGPKMFGCSFPKGVMQNVVASNWWRDALFHWKLNKRAQMWSGVIMLRALLAGYLYVTRATGFTLLLVCLGILIFAMVKSPVLHLALWPAMLVMFFGGFLFYHGRKAHYMPALASGESGKICRGLTAVESAVLLERPLDQVLAMIITDLLNKGAVRATSSDPLTVETAGHRPKPNIVQGADGTRTTLDPYEVGFLDVLVAPPAEVAQKDFSGPLGRLVGLVKCKLEGFDADATRSYYQRRQRPRVAEAQQRDRPGEEERHGEPVERLAGHGRRLRQAHGTRARERAGAYRPFYLNWWPTRTYSTRGSAT